MLYFEKRDLQKAIDLISNAKERIEFLENEIKNYSKDKDIQEHIKYEEHLRNHSLHTFSDIEMERNARFKDEHYSKCKNRNGWVYNLCGTGIGTVIKIKCPVCGEEEDITDYNCW